MLTIVMTIGFVIVFLALAVFLIIYQNKKEKERTRALEATSRQLGWSFSAEAPLTMIPNLERFALFGQGHSKQIKNFMYGVAGGVKAAAFDYIYVTGAGKHRQTHYQSVVYLESTDLDVAPFSLRPEGLMHKMLTAFGYQDIDFGQRPDFSRQYILRGGNETAIRQAFNDRLLSFYENYPGTCTDAAASQVFLFQQGYRFEPREIEGYVGLGLQLVNLLRQY